VLLKEFDGKITFIKDYVFNDKRVVKIIQISTENEPGFDFIPGQFVMISAGNIKNPQDPSRLKFSSMSICSAPYQKGIIELCIRMPNEIDGISMYLKKNAKIGELIKVKGAFGAFNLIKEQSEIVFVATGTGIAPLMSMLRHLVHEKFKEKIYFFYGCRGKKDYLYQDELEKIQKNNSNFELHVSFSREELNGRAGYIQEIVKNYSFPQNKEKIQTYVCGSPRSVEQQVPTLKKHGFKEENIHFEKW